MFSVVHWHFGKRCVINVSALDLRLSAQEDTWFQSPFFSNVIHVWFLSYVCMFGTQDYLINFFILLFYFSLNLLKAFIKTKTEIRTRTSPLPIPFGKKLLSFKLLLEGLTEQGGKFMNDWLMWKLVLWRTYCNTKQIGKCVLNYCYGNYPPLNLSWC